MFHIYHGMGDDLVSYAENLYRNAGDNAGKSVVHKVRTFAPFPDRKPVTPENPVDIASIRSAVAFQEAWKVVDSECELIDEVELGPDRSICFFIDCGTRYALVQFWKGEKVLVYLSNRPESEAEAIAGQVPEFIVYGTEDGYSAPVAVVHRYLVDGTVPPRD